MSKNVYFLEKSLQNCRSARLPAAEDSEPRPPRCYSQLTDIDLIL